MQTNGDLYQGSIFLLLLATVFLFAGWLHLQPKFRPSLAWMFLFGHLFWATGFMFLIAWRGYWQELIETLVWAHERTPLANLVSWKDKPVALSIVQGWLVGLAHFTVGYVLTFAAFLIASTAGKFG